MYTTTAAVPASIEAVAQRVLDDQADDLRKHASGGNLTAAAEALVEAAGINVLTGEPLYTVGEVVGWVERAIEMGATPPRLGPSAIEDVFRLRRVPNAKLRAEYERRVADGEEGLLSTLAHAIGADTKGNPDTTYVERLLGLTKINRPNRRAENGDALYTLRLFVSYEHAVALAEALDLDFHDLGI